MNERATTVLESIGSKAGRGNFMPSLIEILSVTTLYPRPVSWDQRLRL